MLISVFYVLCEILNRSPGLCTYLPLTSCIRDQRGIALSPCPMSTIGNKTHVAGYHSP